MNFKNFFQGKFSFERVIPEQNLLLKGSATFKKIESDVFKYNEQGFYQNTSEYNEFYQKHIYQWNRETLNIYKHGNLLHFLKFTGKTYPFKAIHCHRCIQDIYHLELSILNNNEYQSLYIIKGPKKDFTIKTIFKKY